MNYEDKKQKVSENLELAKEFEYENDKFKIFGLESVEETDKETEINKTAFNMAVYHGCGYDGAKMVLRTKDALDSPFIQILVNSAKQMTVCVHTHNRVPTQDYGVEIKEVEYQAVEFIKEWLKYFNITPMNEYGNKPFK